MVTQEKRIVKLASIFTDFARNVRQAWKYRVEPKPNFDLKKDLPGFFEQIFYNGILVDPDVVELTEAQRNTIHARTGVWYLYRTFRGHRRLKAAMMANQMMPEKFVDVSVTVWIGLPEREEIRLMCDHDGTEPLNEFEQFEAVQRLYGTGMTHEAIGAQVGRKRAWVQDRINILDLVAYLGPFGFTRENYGKRFEPEAKAWVDYIPFTHQDVDNLHILWGDDIAAKVPADSPASKTTAAWLALKEQKVTDPKAPNVKALTKDRMDKIAPGIIKGREGLEIAHRFYNGEGGAINEAVEIYDALTAAASKVPALEGVILEHEATITTLRTEVERLKAEGAALQAELTKANERITELTVTHVSNSKHTGKRS